MKREIHEQIVGRVRKTLLKTRQLADRKVEIAKIRAESLKTPKGKFHLWLNTVVLASDRIVNRKLWRDYHK